jgi:SAM-dependent methyltransferase
MAETRVEDLAREYAHEFAEYEDDDTIRRYRRRSAGEGINYLLESVYGPIFLAAARAAAAETRTERLRILEFGCGAGMAIQYTTMALHDEGKDVELGVGADLVPQMVDAANQELQEAGNAVVRHSVRFVVAANERLTDDLAVGLGEDPRALNGTFHLAIGVNTFRYPVRHGHAAEAVEQLRLLLAPGGRVVVIDMNAAFPYGVKPKRRPPGASGPALRFGTEPLPSLAGYAEPFAAGGFEVIEARNFCWIPHSAHGLRFRFAKAMSPLLDRLAPDRAMRSLVIARKR